MHYELTKSYGSPDEVNCIVMNLTWNLMSKDYLVTLIKKYIKYILR